jgi:hypothetical protein
MATFSNSLVNNVLPLTGMNFSSIYSDGINSIGGSSAGLWYSPNNTNWDITNISSGTISSLSVVGQNAVCCSRSSTGLYYSTGNGWSTWIQSNKKDDSFNNIFMIDTYAVACSASNRGLWCSVDRGVNWTNPVTTGNFIKAFGVYDAVNGVYKFVACVAFSGSLPGGIYYVNASNSSFETWTTSSSSGINLLKFNDLYMVGQNAIVTTTTSSSLATTPANIFYSIDYGATWTQTSTATGVLNSLFNTVIMTSTIAVAGSANSGIWKSTDNGINWTKKSDLLNNSKVFVSYDEPLLMFASQASSTTILKSIDAGETWSVTSSLSAETIFAIGSTVLYGISSSSSRGGLMYSTDTGDSLTQANKSVASIYSICVSSTNSVATINPSGIIYSSNNGASWSSITEMGSSVISLSSAMVGNNVIICNFNGSPFYSTNGGSSYIQASTTSGTIAGNPNFVCMDGTNACLCASNNATSSTTGIWWSSDSGATWTQSTTNTSGTFNFIQIKGSNAIACSNNSTGIWYSINSGKTFTRSNSFNTSSFINVKMYGNIAVSGRTSGQLNYSSDYGVSWFQSSHTASGWIIHGFNNDGTCVVAGGRSTTGGLIYSTSSPLGATWTLSTSQSSITSIGFPYAIVWGYQVLACGSNGSTYYSNDTGATYNPTNLTGKTYSSIAFAYTSEITGYSVVGGINLLSYSSDAPCFNENTTLLTSNNTYQSIKLLTTNDYLQTYKEGLKKIKYIKSFKHIANLNDSLYCMYKMKETDFIISGGHSILLDELLKEEKEKQFFLYNFNGKIHDKYLLLSCVSDKFEKITDTSFTLYHIVLENDDETKNYGIYANGGILTESIPEKYYNEHCKNII